MSIEQVAFEIPARLEAGLATGELIRFGGVVRDSAGHIVTHLNEIPTPRMDKTLALAREFAKTNKATLIVGAAATVAVGGTAIAVSSFNRRKLNRAEKQLQSALSAYFKAIVAQDMNPAVVEKLHQSLGDLRAITGKSTNELVDGDVLDSLISYSRDFILHNAPTQLVDPNTHELGSLDDYLAEQKKIFDQAS